MAKQSVLKLVIDDKEYNDSLKEAQQGMLAFEKAMEDAGGTFERVNKDVLEYTRGIGQMETKSKTVKGRIGEMTNAFTELSARYNRLTDDEKNSPFGEALKSSLEQLKVRIQDGKRELEDINRSLHTVENSGQETSGTMRQLADRFTINVDAMKVFDLGLKAAGSTLGVVKDAFFQSESSIDEWGRTVKSTEAAYDVFLNTLNTGNWSSFFDNLSTAVRGARDLYDALDRLGSVDANNKAAISLVQAEISRLRLLKQAGKDVDDQLKQAISRLSVLRAESVDARKEAGQKMTYETISNRINALYTKEDRKRGVRLSDFDITKAAADIEVNGQAQFDKLRKRYQELNKKAEYQYVTSTGGSITGFSQGITQTGLDFSKLTNSERAEYIIAKAVTEGETQIQEGLALYADAITQQVSNATEEFRYNRYTLTGNKGGGGGTGSEETLPVGSTAALTKQMQELRKDQSLVTNTSEWQEYERQIDEIRNNIKGLTGELAAIGVGGIAKAEGISFTDGIVKQVADAQKALKEKKLDMKIVESKPEKKTEMTLADGISKMTGGISSMASGIQSLGVELPKGLQDVLGGIQGVVSILTGISTIISAIEAISAVDVLKPFHTGGVVKAAGGYRVPGNWGFDAVPALLTSGETVLTRAQAGNLAAQLGERDRGGVEMQPFVDGEKIFLGMNNTSKRMGKGEIVTTSMLRSLGLMR